MTSGRLLLGATPLGQPSDASPRLVDALARRLSDEHLNAVPVGRLMRDAGAAV